MVSYIHVCVPHGILKLVWVKSKCHLYWNLYNWHHWTLPSFSSPSLCFSGSTAIFFNSIKNELGFCCLFIMKPKQKNNKSTNEAWIDQQSHVCSKSKCTLQSLLELRGTPNLQTTHTHEVWNDSHFRLISSPIFQSLLLLLPFN